MGNRGLNDRAMNPPIFTDAIDIRGRSQANFNFNATAQVSSVITADGIYDLWATQDCYVAVSNSNAVSNAVAANTGYLLRFGNTIPFKIRTGDIIGAIQSSVNGTLSYVQVG